MCVKEAAKTSILSRQWRYKWTSIQFLNFNLESLRIPVTAIDDQSAVNKYSNIINTVLFRHSGNVQKFKMTMFNKNRHYEVPDEFIRWMYYLFDHGIQELILEGWNLNIPYIFPSYIFSCKSLVVLRLQCCIFTSPLSIIALPKLKTLDLSNAIDACNRCFEMFISQCPLLENLRLYDVDGILDLTINAPMLKSCVLKGTFESIHLKNATLLSFLYLCPYGTHGRSLEYFEPVDYFQSFFQLKALRELTVHGESIQNLLAGNCPEARVKNLPDLRELTVYELFPGNLVMVSSLFSLIRSCSNLQYLEIHVKDSIYSILPSLEEFLKAMGDPPKCFQHVKSIHLVEISRTMHEMELVKFLLINSPSLGKMIVKSIHKDTCEEHTKMLKDLLSFNRASCKVQIILLSQQLLVEIHVVMCTLLKKFMLLRPILPLIEGYHMSFYLKKRRQVPFILGSGDGYKLIIWCYRNEVFQQHSKDTRGKLLPKNVEALVTTQNWCRGYQADVEEDVLLIGKEIEAESASSA
ncbi:F-box/FBD/LRR-repeat protein At1g13570-like [Chenopodium quinoa]|uniref:F-box/FBD/LRR-repeat protein At1g13570-like n=1 Tax=Chenopodium quinoa TaxID=63459 RepID=UPI000B77D413|nr:F-box/FBD/LRR-repeat protein At1g13570-like [Chenopodium quinoa]